MNSEDEADEAAWEAYRVAPPIRSDIKGSAQRNAWFAGLARGRGEFRVMQFIPRSEESLFVITCPRFLTPIQRDRIDGWAQRMFEHFSQKPQWVFMEGGFRVEAVRDVEVIDYGTVEDGE